MSYCKNKNLKNYAVSGILENIANKENICDFQKPDAQYVNPIYFSQPLEAYNTRRRSWEGGDYHSDVFYDCESIISKEDAQEEPFNIQQFCIYDVINEIDTPKEFKRALKQLIFNSQFLYRTFRQAYRKTKKSHTTSTKSAGVKCEYCCQCSADKKNFERKMDGSDIKNFLKPENGNKTKSVQKSILSDVQSARKPCNTCANCSCGNMKAPICKCPSTIYQEIEDDQESDYICEECAAFKGETSTSKAMEKIYQNSRQVQHSDQSAGTTTRTVNRTVDLNIEQDESTENITPIYLNIPVNLQIDPNLGSVRFLDAVDTAIQSQNSKETQTFVQQLTAMQPKQPTPLTPPNKPNHIPAQTETVTTTQPISSTKKLADPINTTSFKTPPQQIAQTDQKALPEGYKVTEKTSKQQTKLDEIKMKTDQLRSELVQEIKLALEQTLPVDAIQGLKNGDFIALLDHEDEEFPKEETMPVISTQDSNNDEHDTLSAVMEVSDEAEDTATIDRVSLTDATIPTEILQPELPKPFTSAQNSRHDSEVVLYIDAAAPPKPAELYKAEGVQTTVSALKPFGHYQRNEMRRNIQEQLKELIEKRSDHSLVPQYTTEDRNEILFELHRLLHPVKSDLMAIEQKRQSILHDIRYILNSNLPSDLKISNLPASEEMIIDSVRYILNPKAEHKDKSKIRKYESGIKHKILENFLIILKPSQQRTPADHVTRNNAFLEIRLLLDTGVVHSSSRQIHKMVSSLRVHGTKQQMEKLADLRYAQDPTVISGASIKDKDNLNKKKPHESHKHSITLGTQVANQQITRDTTTDTTTETTTTNTPQYRCTEKQEDLNQNKPAKNKKQRRPTFQ